MFSPHQDCICRHQDVGPEKFRIDKSLVNRAMKRKTMIDFLVDFFGSITYLDADCLVEGFWQCKSCMNPTIRVYNICRYVVPLYAINRIAEILAASN